MAGERASGVTQATDAQKACPHEQFRAQVDVNRFEDTGKFMAEVTVVCAQCELGMRVMGVPPGLRWDTPTCSIEGLTLNVPIEPEYERRLFAGASYQVPEVDRARH